MKYIAEGVIREVESEDSGYSLIAELDDLVELGDKSGDHGMFFVRLHSSQAFYTPEELAEPIKHPLMDAINGKRVRVTVETID